MEARGSWPGARLTRRRALGLGAGALLAGCARRPDPTGLTLWAQSYEGENAPRLLPPYTRATGQRVTIQALPWTAAHEKVLTAYAGGVLPDLFMASNDWLAELAMLGAIVPPPPALTADLFPALARAVTIGGWPQAVPWVLDGHAQYYRPDLVREAGYEAPPPDWAGWTRMARAIKRRHPDRWVTLMLLDWPEHLFGYAAQQPEPLLRDRDTRGNFQTPGFLAALAFYKSCFDQGFAKPIVGSEMGAFETALDEGWTAIVPWGPDFVGELHKKRVPADRWAVAPLPGPHGPAGGMVLGSSLAVAATAPDPARAWDLVRFLCAPGTQADFHAMIGALPTRPAAWTRPGLATNPTARVFRDQMAAGTPFPAIPEWARIRTEVQVVAEYLVRGDLTLAAAAAEMDRRVDRILAKRRWLVDRGLVA